jgi:hypothetical protein
VDLCIIIEVTGMIATVEKAFPPEMRFSFVSPSRGRCLCSRVRGDYDSQILLNCSFS